jgi:hypothetical protein
MPSTRESIPPNDAPTPRVGDECAAYYDYPSKDMSEIVRALEGIRFA